MLTFVTDQANVRDGFLMKYYLIKIIRWVSSRKVYSVAEKGQLYINVKYSITQLYLQTSI
jgi:hypothetical protein